MADEQGVFSKALQAIVLVYDSLKFHIKLWYAIFKSIYFFFVPPQPKDVIGEIVLITGTGHGMGREMAARFARLRAIVVCVDVNPKGNQETYDMVKKINDNVFKYECDVTNREAVMELAAKIRKEVGTVTILVNNAGIMPCKPILKQTEKEIRSTMDVNVNAYIWMIQAFLPDMIERNHGHIVAMSSVAGLSGNKNLVPYCGSKYAVRGLMESLAVELRQDYRDLSGIKLTTVYPYIVDTGLVQKPKIKFTSLMPVVNPGDAADQIVDAVRRNYVNITVPSYLYYLFKSTAGLPPNIQHVIQDFVGATSEEHDS